MYDETRGLVNATVRVQKMKREYSIYRTIKLLSKQRVAMVLPGGVLVIEKALPDTELHHENLQTCLMRGWVEVLRDSVPTGNIEKDGSLQSAQAFSKESDLYRLTDSGWNAIHRRHTITTLSVIIALIGLYLAAKC